MKNQKNAKRQTQIVVNSKYDLESIKPWDKVVLLNTTYELPNLVIQKVVYAPNQATLFLDRYETFAETVLSDNN